MILPTANFCLSGSMPLVRAKDCSMVQITGRVGPLGIILKHSIIGIRWTNRGQCNELEISG